MQQQHLDDNITDLENYEVCFIMDEIILNSFRPSEEDIAMHYISMSSCSLSTIENIQSISDILFIGSDVIKATSPKTLPKNFHRIHDRMVKQGQATKMNLKGAKFEGIPHASNIWMYSVLAVFKLAFEYDHLRLQQYLFQHFTDLWLRTYDLPLLPEVLTVHYIPQTVMQPHNTLIRTSNRKNDMKTKSCWGPPIYNRSSSQLESICNKHDNISSQRESTKTQCINNGRSFNVIDHLSSNSLGDLPDDHGESLTVTNEIVVSETGEEIVRVCDNVQAESQSNKCSEISCVTRYDSENCDLSTNECINCQKTCYLEQSYSKELTKSCGNKDGKKKDTINSTDNAPNCVINYNNVRQNNCIVKYDKEDEKHHKMICDKCGIKQIIKSNKYGNNHLSKYDKKESNHVKCIEGKTNHNQTSVKSSSCNESKFEQTNKNKIEGYSNIHNCVLEPHLQTIEETLVVFENEIKYHLFKHDSIDSLENSALNISNSSTAGTLVQQEDQYTHKVSKTILKLLNLARSRKSHSLNLILKVINLSDHILSTLKSDDIEAAIIIGFLEDFIVYTEDDNVIDCAVFSNDFGIPVEKNRFLCFISEWFGRELCSLRGVIMNKSESFKQMHIYCIDNLPPAKDVVGEIFPQCMINLFLSWMNKDILPDTGSPPKKRRKNLDSHHTDDNVSECSDLYPFIQLLLEFANNCLVSGVAHVVYPRLLGSK